MDIDESASLKENVVFFDDIGWAPCSLGRACSFLMMPFVLALVALTYLPYVFYLNNGTPWGRFCMLTFHLLISLTGISYFQTVFTDPGTVPHEWHIKVSGVSSPAYKKCRHSHKYKPLRSHYCSVTGRVVLNLDHFCPWVANAVGFKNRKFFILFCFYSMLASLFAACTLAPYALVSMELQNGAAHSFQRALALMAFIMDVTFAIALCLFSVAHFYLAAKNQTSLEGEKVSKRYDLGWKDNMKCVFGRDPRFWFLPFHRSQLFGDGVHWKLTDGTWDGFANKDPQSNETEV